MGHLTKPAAVSGPGKPGLLAGNIPLMANLRMNCVSTHTERIKATLFEQSYLLTMNSDFSF
jgi:hypothetical protein